LETEVKDHRFRRKREHSQRGTTNVGVLGNVVLKASRIGFGRSKASGGTQLSRPDYRIKRGEINGLGTLKRKAPSTSQQSEPAQEAGPSSNVPLRRVAKPSQVIKADAASPGSVEKGGGRKSTNQQRKYL